MSKTIVFGRCRSAWTAVLGAVIALLGSVCVQAQTLRLKWVEAGAAVRMPPVSPHRIDLTDQRPPQIKRIPADVTNPLYGVLTIGPAESAAHFNVLLDAPPGRRTRLFVDANGNGDFTDDPRPQWDTKSYIGGDRRNYTEMIGGVTVTVPYGRTRLPLHLNLRRYDPADAVRAGYQGALLCTPDYAREGDLKLGAKTYHAMLLDAIVGGDFRGLLGGGATGIFLLIDVNGNGLFDARGEFYSAGQPFNIGGITYELRGMTASGETMDLVKSAAKVAEIPPPPDLRIGKVVPSFAKKATSGAAIHFPADYRGKIVLLSFWASDCGVCAAEMPDVVRAYHLFHAQGLEIVGVSLDHENAAAQITGFTKRVGMPWPQIYDGKWLQADVAQLYFVQRTPTSILVEGDTGRVLASGADLRGANLQKTVAAALNSRTK